MGRFHASFLILLATLGGCDDAPDPPVPTTIGSFSDAFERETTVTLEQSDSMPLVVITDLVQGPDGTLAASDFSEGHVRLFDSSGKILRTIGRKGNGPGEFLGPVAVRWDRARQLHVLDLHRMLISTFTRDGQLVRETKLASAGNASDFAPLNDGGYLLLRVSQAPELLARIDSAGGLVKTYLPIADYRPTGQKSADVWRQALVPSMDVRGDTAWVAISTADSVWAVDLRSGGTTSFSIRPPDYRQPRDPPGPVDTDSAWNRWREEHDRINGLSLEGNNVLVTFTRNVGDATTSTLVVRTPDGTHHVYREAEQLGRLTLGRFSSLRQTDDRVEVAFWRRRT